MDQETVLKAIQHLGLRLKESGLTVSRIILFGSHAHETATEESDIDIAIISDDFEGKTIFERALMTKDAEIDTMRRFVVPLDIITLTNRELASETSPIAGYAQQGRVIHGCF